MQSESDKFLTSSENLPLGQLINSLEDARFRHNKHTYDTSDIKSIISLIDMAVGKLISFSIKQCPDLAKAWGAYGNWCYRWGRKIVELRSENDDKSGLRNNDISNIMEIIPSASSSDIEQITVILNQHKILAEDEEVSLLNSAETSSTEIMESDLRTITILKECSSEKIQKIIEIWREANKSVYLYYEMAADAYFKYLQLATQSQDDNFNKVESNAQTSANEDNAGNENCSVVTATLRILRLIVKHALGLQEVLEEGLETTPTSPWKVIYVT